jgi:hypothetical protein
VGDLTNQRPLAHIAGPRRAMRSGARRPTTLDARSGILPQTSEGSGEAGAQSGAVSHGQRLSDGRPYESCRADAPRRSSWRMRSWIRRYAACLQSRLSDGSRSRRRSAHGTLR